MSGKKSISFIIIGRNEGWKLTKCLESVYNAIYKNHLTDHEVIYIDSRSTDDSIERTGEYKDLKIFKITSGCNAAIARNIGADESKGDILCFLDGDMELYSDFVRIILGHNKSNYLFISGQLLNYYYDENWEHLKAGKLLPENKLDTFDVTNGGAFVIEKRLWKLFNGLRTKYERCEDIDLNYRLTNHGYKIYRYSDLMVNHHTIQHDYKVDIINDLRLNLKYYFFRGLIIRDHLFNLRVIRDLLRLNYSLFFLVFITVLSLISKSYFWILLYIVLISVRSFSRYIKFRAVIKTSYINFLIKYIYQDIIAVFSILLFYPKNKKVSYQHVS